MKQDKQLLINILFDAAKGDVAVDSREAVADQPLGSLPVPVRSGYRFVGWFAGDTPVNADTVAGDVDLHLSARWEKKKKNERTAFQKQKRACILLGCLILFLAVSLAVVNHFVEIYGVTDTYVNESGETVSDRYYAKKKNGVYGLYNKDGDLMVKNSDGYYIAEKSGNQYSVDESTGQVTLYAVVDYDAEGGEVLDGTRIMIRPQVQQKYIYSIHVKNDVDEFTVYRMSDGTVCIEGTEGSSATVDQTQYAYFCTSCGYLLTLKKLDLSADNALIPRNADGSVNRSAYGFDSPATFTVTLANKNEVDASGTYSSSGESYTMEVGDKTVTGGGYYIRKQGGDAVYVISSTLESTVLAAREAMVAPQVLYPMELATYSMPINFHLAKVDLTGFTATTDEDGIPKETVVKFDYEDLLKREETLKNSTPYLSKDPLMEGYELNDSHIGSMLQNLYTMEFISCKKLGIDDESLTEYGFFGEAYYLTFSPPYKDEDGNIAYYEELRNSILISPKNADGNYYIASFTYDMIVEVDGYYLTFLEWEKNEWYREAIFQNNISYMKELHFEQKNNSEGTAVNKQFDFTFDNSETVLTDENATATDNMKIYCEQYDKNAKHQLDYTITKVEDKGYAGVETTKTYTALDNFKKLYQNLLYFTVEGVADQAEFEASKGSSIASYIAAHGDDYDAMLSYRAEDLAKTFNSENYSENNEKYLIFRFYQYSDRKALVTVEALKRGEDGEWETPNSTDLAGVFFVSPSYLDMLADNMDTLLEGKELIKRVA